MSNLNEAPINPLPAVVWALALPMIGLFFAAVGVAMLLDRRRARHEPDWAKLPDDEASTLDDDARPLDDQARPL